MSPPRWTTERVLGVVLATALTLGAGLTTGTAAAWLAHDSPWNPAPPPPEAGLVALGLGVAVALAAGGWLFRALGGDDTEGGERG